MTEKTILLPKPPGQNGHDAAYRLNLMVPKRRYLAYLRERWWVILVCAALCLGAILAYETLRPERYVSFAQIYTSGEVQLNGANIFSEEQQTYYGTQIELLKSSALQQVAFERIGYAPKPESKPPVTLEVVQPMKTSILVLQATGSDPHQTQQFLQALVDEYLAYKKETRRTTTDDVMLSITEQLTGREKELKSEQDRWVDFQRTNNVAVLEEEAKSAGLYLADLNLQLAKLKLDRELLKHGLSPEANSQIATISKRAQAAANDKQTITNAAAHEEAPSMELAPGFTGPSDTSLKSLRVELALRRAERDQTLVERGEMAARRLNEQVQRLERAVSILEEQAVAEKKFSLGELETRISAMEASIPAWQSKVLTFNERLSESQRIRNDIQREQGFYDRLLATLQTVDLGKNVQQERLSVLQPATPAKPTNRYLAVRFGLALLFGVGLGLTGVLGWYLADDRLVSVGDLKDQFGETVLGLVPEIKVARTRPREALLRAGDPRVAYTESYRHLRSALLLSALGGNRPQTLLFTGAAPSEGKSTIAANVATVLARSGLRVVLVDADRQAAGLGNLFDAHGKPGVLDFLRGEADASQILHSTDVSGLKLVPAGTHADHAEGLFLRPKLAGLIDQLKVDGDFILIDAPPILGTDDAALLVPYADVVVLVVRPFFSRSRLLRQVLDMLYQRQAKQVALIVNRARKDDMAGHYAQNGGAMARNGLDSAVVRS